jgi:ParB-like chromosome segregation protein Spo0J
MQIRDRIRDFRRVRAGALRPHPRNWRTHPPAQQAAMRGVLAEIGYADALLVRELAGGELQLIDGHLRAELTPDALVPVLVLDVTEEEALKLLVTLDPLAAQAQTDARLLHGLLEEVQTESEALAGVLESLAEANPLANANPLVVSTSQSAPDDLFVPASFQVVVQCEDEDQQRDVYERLKSEGYQCRVLSL